MKLKDCSFLADENIHPALVAYLRENGLDVRTVSQLNLAGASDIRIINEAYNTDRIILTHDSDFGTLAVIGNHAFKGIIYIRPGHITGDFSIETIKSLFSQNLDFTERTIIIAQRQNDEVKIRIRNTGDRP